MKSLGLITQRLAARADRAGLLGAARRLLRREAAGPGGDARTDTLLREALDFLPQGVVVLDADGRYVLWNAAYADIYAGSADLLRVGDRLEDALREGIARGQYPEALGREEEWLAKRLDRMRHPDGRFEQSLADGRCVLIDERRTSDGGFVGLRVDITDLKRREASFRLLFEANPVPMFLVAERDDTILSANDAALRHYGYALVDLVGLAFSKVEPGGSLIAVDTGDGNARSCHHRTADGGLIDVTVFSRPLDYEGEPARLIAAFDVTARNRAEARAAFLAHHDPLTGLANRTYLQVRLQELFQDDGIPPRFAILLMDLDHFKLVNDTLGHQTGDLLLAEVGWRMKAVLREGDFVARLGGDEFAIITAVAEPTELDLLAERLIASVSTPFLLDGHEVSVGASIGIAVAPTDGLEANMVMRSADLALYRAKADGRNTFHYFEAEMDAQLQARRVLEIELRQAVETSTLTVHYQPLVDLSTGEIAAFEALVRWHHPVRGDIPPTEFIALAEESNLIVKLGAFVLERACHDALDWPDPVKVAVNLSPVQFRAGTVFAAVRAALDKSGLPPARLELEITETLLLERTDTVLATLHALRALGIRISMDDFGTGYSSLSYLRSFPFDKIKIDRSFVRDMGANPDAAAIVKTIVDLGASLGIKVTAEGIEDETAAEMLASQGCREGQGYYFSRPRPAEEARALLQTSAARRTA